MQKKITKVHQIPSHTKACPWRPFPCFFHRCSFVALTGALLATHLLKGHKIEVISGEFGNQVLFQIPALGDTRGRGRGENCVEKDENVDEFDRQYYFLVRMTKQDFLVELSQRGSIKGICIVSVQQLSRVGKYEMELEVKKSKEGEGEVRTSCIGAVRKYGEGGGEGSVCFGLWFSLLVFGEDGGLGPVLNLSLKIN